MPTGYLPGVSGPTATDLTYGGAAGKRRLGPVIRWALSLRDRTRIWVGTWAGTAGYDLRPGRGMVARPSLLSLGGVIGKRRLTDRFHVSYLESVLPCGALYDGTDCPLSLDGAGAHLTTADTVYCMQIDGRAGEPATAWRIF